MSPIAFMPIKTELLSGLSSLNKRPGFGKGKLQAPQLLGTFTFARPVRRLCASEGKKPVLGVTLMDNRDTTLFLQPRSGRVSAVASGIGMLQTLSPDGRMFVGLAGGERESGDLAVLGSVSTGKIRLALELEPCHTHLYLGFHDFEENRGYQRFSHVYVRKKTNHLSTWSCESGELLFSSKLPHLKKDLFQSGTYLGPAIIIKLRNMVATSSNNVKLWSLKNGKLLGRLLHSPTATWSALAASHSGTLLAAAGYPYGGTMERSAPLVISVCSLYDGEEISRIKTDSRPYGVTGLAFCPKNDDYLLLAVRDKDKTETRSVHVELRDIPKGERLWTRRLKTNAQPCWPSNQFFVLPNGRTIEIWGSSSHQIEPMEI